jgi:hypothetical protein
MVDDPSERVRLSARMTIIEGTGRLSPLAAPDQVASLLDQLMITVGAD